MTDFCYSTPGHIDLEDEAEVGTDLTLIKSEDVVLVPDEDRNREDEDKTELDEAEDLEDLDGIRILRVEDVIVNKKFSLGSETLENTVKPKSQTVNRFPNDPIILVTLSESQEVMDGRDMVRNSWSSPADRNVALTTSFPTSRKPTRRTPRPRVTVPPRFRYTFFPLPEGRGQLGFGECCFWTGVSVTNKSLSSLILLIFPNFVFFHLTTSGY